MKNNRKLHEYNIEKEEFRRDLWQLALPVTFQCLLQSSFSVVDQVMAGQLGSVGIAAIGLAGKFAFIFSVLVAAIASAAGIIIAQAIGKKDEDGLGKGFYTNLLLALMLAAAFTFLSVLFPGSIMGIYIKDADTIAVASGYLRVYAISFFPMALTSLFSAYLRCVKLARVPLYASICAALINTALNYLLIFGKCGFPALGVQGAAWASAAAQLVGCGIIIIIFFKNSRKGSLRLPFALCVDAQGIRQYAVILIPILASEVFWSLGENVYAFIYGHMGTKACAAMTLINPIQSLTIGALSGISQASGIMIGRSLGAGETKKAYDSGRKLMRTGLLGSVICSLLLLLLRFYYVEMFRVEWEVRTMTIQILTVFAVILPIKVLNMILGGGILRSGGKTKYIMVIDFIGTWLFGVPLGLLAGFKWRQPIACAYFILSLEELVRLGISLWIFRKKRWMQQL